MSRELITFFAMTGCAIVCSLVYDFFRGLHSELKNHDIIVMITDAIYWVFVTFAIMWSLWYFNTGEIRIYELAGLMIGAILYFCTVSKWIFGFFEFIVKKFAEFMRYIFKILLTLLRFLYKILVMPISCFVGEKVNKTVKKRRTK